MNTIPKKITVFYAWQNDVSQKANRYAIRDALHAVSSKLSLELNLEVEIDEATRDMVGSGNIPQEILRKIKAADIFVGDITTINSTASGSAKRTPNPNVTFELGFAVAYLGWPRIVLLFNKHFGDPKDAPFDFDRQRISNYTFSEEPSLQKSHKSDLAGLCETALKGIIKSDPKKQYDLRNLTDEEVKRARDVVMLSQALEWVHWPSLQRWVHEGPKYLPGIVLHLCEGLNEVVRDPMFHIFDVQLSKHVAELAKIWGESLDSEHFHDISRGAGLKYAYHIPQDIFQSREQEEDYKRLEGALERLGAAMHAALAYIRTNYLEVDLLATNARALDAYREHRASIDRTIAEMDARRATKTKKRAKRTRGSR